MARTNSKKKRDKRNVDPTIHRGVWDRKPVHLTTKKKVEIEEQQARIDKQKGWI